MIDKDSTHIGVGYYKSFWVQVFAYNPSQKFTLTIDANGGYFPSRGGITKFDMYIPSGMTLSVDDIPKPEKEGSSFKKWTTVDATYGMESGVKSEIHMFDNQTLKANWADSSD